MATPVDGFAAWLAQAQIPEAKLTPAQRGVLQAAFAFRQRCGQDYYSTRLLSHFLLHADTGLKVAQIARLLRLSRPTASPPRRPSKRPSTAWPGGLTASYCRATPAPSPSSFSRTPTPPATTLSTSSTAPGAFGCPP